MTARTGVCMKCGAVKPAKELRELSIGQACKDDAACERARRESATLAAR